MSPRGAAVVVALALTGLGAVAAWLTGVPILAIGVASAVTLLIAGRRIFRARTPGSPSPKQGGAQTTVP